MSSCNYEEVRNDINCEEHPKVSIQSVLKQVFIASSVWMQYFMAGMCVGAPTVFIPQIRKETNSTTIIDDEMGSWLYSTSGFAMYPWIFILPFMTSRFGRKLPQLATSVCTTATFIILYFSQNPYHILISEVLQGFVYAGNITIRILITTEYTSIKFRGLFLSIKSASFFWGIWVANAIGTYFYWKNIAIVGFICSIYTFNVIFWPESPFWLASKDRFDECKASYRWIHGYSARSEKKLQDMISWYIDKNDDVNLFRMVKDKEFYKPILLCVSTVIQYHFSGKVICSLYILDILKSFTNDTATAYMSMLILDGLSVFGMYFGSYLSKILKRRTLYMSSSFTGLFFLFIISLYLYLVRFSVVTQNNYITIGLLAIYTISISCGPMILCLSIYGEIIPLKYQLSSYMITGLTFTIFFSSLVKFTPSIFTAFGIHGTFLFYFITFGVCTVYLYIYMPETKNRTHKEIALFFKHDNTKIVERSPLN
ncbi:facilitated trehalose transporter Tret1-like [Nymphalis io]|uniref:facilitated trehalose transporter Tret1-like n=1 Tax=Inachis io TaxID=171585 RepID=UPI00216A9AFB|nr:facilitated trehalose transporter Tret1-like [Nymphalis io]